MICFRTYPFNRNFIGWIESLDKVLGALEVEAETAVEEDRDDQCSDLHYFIPDEKVELVEEAINLVSKETKGPQDITEEYLNNLKIRLRGKYGKV